MWIAGFLVGAVLIFCAAYRFYGGWLSDRFGLDDSNAVPSRTMYDGVDFVPSRPLVVLGHHFSSIAGAGPIVGPVIAAIYFGWLPALLWIVLGSIFIGGVHDFGSLMASLRHKAASIAEVGREYMSSFAGRLFLIFIWLALVYVIVVFLDLTAATFVQDGGVASSSTLFIFLAVAFGWVLTRRRLGFWPALAVALPLLGVCVWLGGELPLTNLPALFGSTKNTWCALLLVYAFVASVAPVWLLLQPRDFLCSFLLYFAVIGGAFGLAGGALFGGLNVQWPAHVPASAVEALGVTHIGPLFPILFITIACGACSGFHSIVSSGTTARQIGCETDARRIGYGGMLIEGFVAIIALGTVMVMPFGSEIFRQNPMLVYGQGMGRFLATFGIDPALGTHLALLAVSTFLLTTLDTCTRLTRFIVQELFGWDNTRAANRYISTLLTIIAPAVLVFLTLRDATGAAIPMWKAIWPVFGATNQLLGGLALLAVTIWLKKTGRSWIFAAIPMIFMLAVTLTALVSLFRSNGFNLVGVITLTLFLLGLLIVAEAVRAFAAPEMNRENLQQIPAES